MDAYGYAVQRSDCFYFMFPMRSSLLLACYLAVNKVQTSSTVLSHLSLSSLRTAVLFVKYKCSLSSTMSSTFNYTHPSLRLSSKPKAVPRGREPDSFDVQRDMLMSIIHQHFDQPEEERLQPSNQHQNLKGYHNAGMLSSSGQRRSPSITKAVSISLLRTEMDY